MKSVQALNHVVLQRGDRHLLQSMHGAVCRLLMQPVDVLNRALREFDGWITGQKRYQSSTRSDIARVDWDAERNKWKFNPLADWSMDDVETHREKYDLPRHPLADLGYSSVGCAPCTSPVGFDEDARAGRWRGQQKLECGLHRNPNIIAASVA